MRKIAALLIIGLVALRLFGQSQSYRHRNKRNQRSRRSQMGKMSQRNKMIQTDKTG